MLKVLNYVLAYISRHPTGLEILETKNHKRKNSDRRNVEILQTVIYIVKTYFFSFNFVSLQNK